MEIHELQQLLSEMSLQEKIGQMVQLTGAYFDKEAVLTGVVGEQLPPEWIIQYAGIIKENGTVVVEQQDKRAMQVIEQEAQKKHARIITVEQSDIARCSGYALRLCGTFQAAKGQRMDKMECTGE